MMNRRRLPLLMMRLSKIQIYAKRS